MNNTRKTPLSTYRLQLNEHFTFAQASSHVPYIASLGITHLYLSPILTAAPASTHGYDVVNHGQVSETLGGLSALRLLAKVAHEHELGIILDLVPNHMSVPTPAWHNRALWSVLAEGATAATTHWFDVDWSAGDGALLMPVLGERIGKALALGLFEVGPMTGEESAAIADLTPSGKVLRYHEHVFPVRSGSEHLPMAELLQQQHYRLAWWQVGDDELNYRRFFDIDTLAAIRVEDERVFNDTHALVFQLLEDGIVDGLRIDHPDGLADPKAYLDALANRAGNCWVVVEKILSPAEALPGNWACSGTTGYDAQWRVQLSFIDAAGASSLGALMQELTGDASVDFPTMQQQARQQIIDGCLSAEVKRLVKLAYTVCHSDISLWDHTIKSIRACIESLLIHADRYRYYVTENQLMNSDVLVAFNDNIDRSRQSLESIHHDTLAVLAMLLSGRNDTANADYRDHQELMTRFQQVQGAVMAKGVEDTAYYRWTHLTALNEVGGAPERFAIEPEELHEWACKQQQAASTGMTCLSTHDTKRSEDMRARMAVLSELADEWTVLIRQVRRLANVKSMPLVDGRMENLLWQTLAATWSPTGPLNRTRLSSYLVKAMREAKQYTSWLTPDADYENAMIYWLDSLLNNELVIDHLQAWTSRTTIGVRANILGMKLVQLTLPGVADVYQGSEVVHTAMVDPDNRQLVDFDALQVRKHRLEDRSEAADLDDEKLQTTIAALRVRKKFNRAFMGPSAGYRPVPTSSAHALAFARLEKTRPVTITVATRLALTLERHDGWQAHTINLPEGQWRNALNGCRFTGGEIPLGQLLETLPVALLTRA